MTSSPALVQVNEEANIVSQCGNFVRVGCRDDEGKEIVNESVECLQKKEKENSHLHSTEGMGLHA